MVHLCHYKMERASLEVRRLRIRVPMQGTGVQSLGGEDPLEEGMATHSSVLAWRIPTGGGAWRAAVQKVAESGATEATQHARAGTQQRGGGWKPKESVGFSKHKGGSPNSRCSRPRLETESRDACPSSSMDKQLLTRFQYDYIRTSGS